MPFVRIHATGLVAFVAIALCSRNAYAGSMLFAASPYNAFMLNNFTASFSDTQGGLAAGGDITINGYSVAQNVGSFQALSGFPSAYTLVAGGLLSASSGELYAGDAYGSTTNVPGSFSLNGGTLTSGGNQVIDFSQAGQQLGNLSTSLAGRATTAGDSCTLLFGTVTCTAVGNNLNIINISNPGEFAGNSIVITSTGTNATLVINVAGTNATLGGAGFSAFNNGVTLLFNYYEATTLQLGSSGFTTSVLAPLATVSPTGGGNFDGTLIANNFTGQMEFHNNDLFAGDLTEATPEPTSMLLAGAGLISIVFFLRRRARSRNPVGRLPARSSIA